MRKRKFLALLGMNFLKGYATLFGLYRRKFMTALNFKLRFLTKKLIRRFYNFSYLKGRAKRRLNERNRIVKNLARFYFVVRYNGVKELKPRYMPYAAY